MSDVFDALNFQLKLNELQLKAVELFKDLVENVEVSKNRFGVMIKLGFKKSLKNEQKEGEKSG